MKKITTIVSAMLMALTLTSCGFNPGMTAGGATTGGATGTTATSGAVSAIGKIISVFAGGVLTNQATIVGRWTYVQPCVQFESNNALTKAGGAVAAQQVEAKLATYYQKVGITPGAFTFTFNQDGTCAYTIGGRSNTATYTFDSTRKTITLQTQMGHKVTAYVSVTGTTMGLTFDTTKLLTLMQGVSAASSSLSSISQIASSFNGMKLGFELKK